MRIREFNFAVAIAASVTAHMLLWPASKRIHVPTGDDGDRSTRVTEVTLRLNPDTADALRKPPLPPPPKVPLPDSPDEMGEKTGKGTGAQPAKGKEAMKAQEADQDQPFTNKTPPGNGRASNVPPIDGRRGQDGSGGQRGGPAVAMNKPTPSATPAPPAPAPRPPQETKTPDVEPSVLPPKKSPVHTPPPPTPNPAPPADVAPRPSKTASVGAGTVDLKKLPADEVKRKAPFVQVASAGDGTFPIAPKEGPTVVPQPAVGTAPPTPKAPPERRSVVLAPPLQLPPAPVSAPPPPAVEPAPIKPAKKPDVAVPQAPAAPKTPTPPASSLVATGNGRAPGQDRPSALPAQESESESDPFSKTHVSAVMHDGRLEVREGRKVKTTRPHILPGGYAELFVNPNASLVLKISIDEAGNVKGASIIHSTGSVEIDQPCVRAVYDWWFEPMHDKQGRPISDVVVFTIQFR